MTQPAPRGSPAPPPRSLYWDTAAPPATTARPQLWHLTGLRHLSTVRREARELLTRTNNRSGQSTQAHDDAVDRAVLVLDELASNALRHGQPPAWLELADDGDSWLIVATDAATALLPVPAVGRAEGLGGYGLYVITTFTLARGTHVVTDHKRVWARLPKR